MFISDKMIPYTSSTDKKQKSSEQLLSKHEEVSRQRRKQMGANKIAHNPNAAPLYSPGLRVASRRLS